MSVNQQRRARGQGLPPPLPTQEPKLSPTLPEPKTVVIKVDPNSLAVQVGRPPPVGATQVDTPSPGTGSNNQERRQKTKKAATKTSRKKASNSDSSTYKRRASQPLPTSASKKRRKETDRTSSTTPQQIQVKNKKQPTNNDHAAALTNNETPKTQEKSKNNEQAPAPVAAATSNTPAAEADNAPTEDKRHVTDQEVVEILAALENETRDEALGASTPPFPPGTNPTDATVPAAPAPPTSPTKKRKNAPKKTPSTAKRRKTAGKKTGEAAPPAASPVAPVLEQPTTLTTDSPSEDCAPKKKAPRSPKNILLCKVAGCPRRVVKLGCCNPHLEDPEAKVLDPVDDTDSPYERYTGPAKKGRKKKNPEEEQPSAFAQSFEQLVEFQRQHGHANVPASNESLCSFVRATRRKYIWVTQLGKTSRMLSQERIDKLDELDFEWKAVTDGDWDDCFKQLKAYHQEHVHCRVTTKQDSALSKFVEKTRKNYVNVINNGVTSQMLTQERIDKLNEIGFEWKCWSQGAWDQRFQDLQEYKIKHKTFSVPRKDDVTLSSWTKTQRTGYRNFMAMLKADNDRNMNGRPGFPNRPQAELDKEYEDLAKKRPILNAERVIKLQMIGFEWAVQEDQWEESWERQFRELLQFKAEFGHTRVSRNYADNIQLGMWVKGQRRARTKQVKGTGGETLSAERIRRLNEIEFEWRLKP